MVRATEIKVKIYVFMLNLSKLTHSRPTKDKNKACYTFLITQNVSDFCYCWGDS